MLSEDELRTLVRDEVERQLDRRAKAAGPPSPDHGSHARFAGLETGGSNGACLIEPAVRCVQCGYCQSFGH